MAKKSVAQRAMEGLDEQQQPSPGLTDEELLSPDEQAMLEQGNAPETPEPAQPEVPTEPETPATPEDEVAAPAADEDEDLSSQTTVPVAVALKERRDRKAERDRREAIERDYADLRTKWDKMNERLLAIQERQTQAAAPAQQPAAADPEPDREANYTGWLEWNIRRANDQIATLANNQQNQGQAVQATQVTQALAGMEQQFVQAGHPDYYDRVNFLRERRDRELQLMGYVDPMERQRMIATEASMIVQGAIRQGRNFAEVIHELSGQWGFGANGAPAQPAAAPARPAQTPQQQIAQQQRRTAAATSVAALRGKPPEGPITLEDMARMDDDAYEKFVEKNGGDLQALLRSQG